MDLKNMTTNEKAKLAENPSTPLDILRKLAKDKDSWRVRTNVARNPSTPIAVLHDLAKDEYSGVRMYVALNPSISLDILRKLAKDVNFVVRRYVAKNPKVSSKLLVMLFEYEKSLREPDFTVIKVLYAHKNLPGFVKSVIETLFGEML